MVILAGTLFVRTIRLTEEELRTLLSRMDTGSFNALYVREFTSVICQYYREDLAEEIIAEKLFDRVQRSDNFRCGMFIEMERYLHLKAWAVQGEQGGGLALPAKDTVHFNVESVMLSHVLQEVLIHMAYLGFLYPFGKFLIMPLSLAGLTSDLLLKIRVCSGYLTFMDDPVKSGEAHRENVVLNDVVRRLPFFDERRNDIVYVYEFTQGKVESRTFFNESRPVFFMSLIGVVYVMIQRTSS